MWLAPPDPAPRYEGAPKRFHVAIAIPARNEAGTIGFALAALDVAAGFASEWLASIHVVVCANNCSDATANRAAEFDAQYFRLVVDRVTLDAGSAHAGGARRAALCRASRLLPPDGVLVTTDADSKVAPDWLTALLGEFARGADAVAGAITLDAGERAQLPDLPGRDAEWMLSGLLARIEDRIDPIAHDPMPRHIWAWGANLALTLRAYRRVGGLPDVPLAEDRALADRLLLHDLKLRRSTAPLVYTSARTSGRAAGGFADLIRGFADDRNMPCDAALEPVDVFVRRLHWRAHLRRVWETQGRNAALAAAMPLMDGSAELPGSQYFGQFWADVETRAPQLQRERILPAQLEGELHAARRWLDRLNRGATDRADTLPRAAAG